MEHKLSTYADDILFPVTDPLVSLPNLMVELKAYRLVSNFKINYTKSEILPITLPSALSVTLRSAFPFTRAHASLTYLRIQLTSQLELLYATNKV